MMGSHSATAEMKTQVPNRYTLKVGKKDFKKDVLLTPTTLTYAPKYDDLVRNDNRYQCALQDYCTQPANMAGMHMVMMIRDIL